jgi:LAO/AO transport system kinase
MTARELAQLATAVENGEPLPADLPRGNGLILGITGPPGAGKSSLAGALTSELRRRSKTVAVVAVDPTSKATGGAILGDRIRMQNHYADPGVFIRSVATRGAQGGLGRTSIALARLFRSEGFDFVLVETVGAGQDEIDIAASADATLVVLVPGMGDDVQAIKAGMMEVADIFIVNKADRPGLEQTVAEIEAMLSLSPEEERAPIFRTVALNGTGVPELVNVLVHLEPKVHDPNQRPDSQWLIDHVGIAVRSLDETLPFYTEQMGMKLVGRETIEQERVHVAMLSAGPSRIELLEPTSPDSTVSRFLDRRGPGLHHVAMRVDDLPAVLRRLESGGAKLLGVPQRGAGGHLYGFVHPISSGGVLWEIIQNHGV